MHSWRERPVWWRVKTCTSTPCSTSRRASCSVSVWIPPMNGGKTPASMPIPSGIEVATVRTASPGGNVDEHAAYVRSQWHKFQPIGAPLHAGAAGTAPALLPAATPPGAHAQGDRPCAARDRTRRRLRAHRPPDARRGVPADRLAAAYAHRGWVRAGGDRPEGSDSANRGCTAPVNPGLFVWPDLLADLLEESPGAPAVRALVVHDLGKQTRLRVLGQHRRCVHFGGELDAFGRDRNLGPLGNHLGAVM